jgi:hypothetical protein
MLPDRANAREIVTPPHPQRFMYSRHRIDFIIREIGPWPAKMEELFDEFVLFSL